MGRSNSQRVDTVLLYALIRVEKYRLILTKHSNNVCMVGRHLYIKVLFFSGQNNKHRKLGIHSDLVTPGGIDHSDHFDHIGGWFAGEVRRTGSANLVPS